MSSGRGNVGAQHRGGRGGRGGGGLFDTYGAGWLGSGYGAQSGHGGFARAGGGGGGGGRRPFRGGGGPMGHRYEDPRRDGRVQKNRGRGGGRGRGGRGRGGARGGRGGARGGGQAMADKLESWVSEKHYQNRESGAREQPTGVNYDAQLNRVRPKEGPPVENGLVAVENNQRDRLVNSTASQFEAADPRSGDFVGINLEARNVHSLVARAHRTQPEGTRYNVLMRAVKVEDGLISSEAAKQQLYGAMVSTADPFAFEKDEEDETVEDKATDDVRMEDDHGSPRRTADEEMARERQRDAAQNPNYEATGSRYHRDKEYYKYA